MTDKNIIDEVNVSRCKYFNNGWCLLSESCDVIKYKSCGDMTLADCYYRNWQRKEQEVQQAMDNYVQLDLKRVKEYNELVDLYKAKEQECEELKKEIAFGNNGTLSDKIRAEVFKELNNENDQLKQTLTEIKYIAENMNEECFYDDFDCMNCDMQNGCTYFNKKQILQKSVNVR